MTVAATCLVSDIATTHRWEPNHTWAPEVQIKLVGPDGTVAALSMNPNAASGFDSPYTFAPTGTPWPGAVIGGLIASGTYAAPGLGNFISGPANGVWTLRVLDLAGGDVGSVSEMSVRLPVTRGRSCRSGGAHLRRDPSTADPLATDGTYLIDPDGPGSAPGAMVYCDMTGGGWTLVMASHSLGPSMQTATSPVLPGSGTYLRHGWRARFTAPRISARVHVRYGRGRGDALNHERARDLAHPEPARGLPPERQLALPRRERRCVGDVDRPAGWRRELPPWHSCGVAPYGSVGTYPDIYWACNNKDGFHLFGADE